MEDRCRPTTRLVFELIAIEKINSKDEQLYILQMVAESPHNNYIKQQADFIFVGYPKQGKPRSQPSQIWRKEIQFSALCH
jgi:hypothetical protein